MLPLLKGLKSRPARKREFSREILGQQYGGEDAKAAMALIESGNDAELDVINVENRCVMSPKGPRSKHSFA
jgi:hypothetical protein